MKTTNAKAREYVEAREPFTGAANSYSRNGYSLSGDNYRHKPSGTLVYIVLSYGYYPIFIYDYSIGAWYENDDSFSRTTAKQMGQCHPHNAKVVRVPRAEMEDIYRSSVLAVASANA